MWTEEERPTCAKFLAISGLPEDVIYDIVGWIFMKAERLSPEDLTCYLVVETDDELIMADTKDLSELDWLERMLNPDEFNKLKKTIRHRLGDKLPEESLLIYLSKKHSFFALLHNSVEKKMRDNSLIVIKRSIWRATNSFVIPPK